MLMAQMSTAVIYTRKGRARNEIYDEGMPIRNGPKVVSYSAHPARQETR